MDYIGDPEVSQKASVISHVRGASKVVETTISTTKKTFGHGRHRVELGLFLQLAGLTANRPQAVLNLRYRHIRVSLLRDPQGGPPRIVIEFTFEFTKEFLGTGSIIHICCYNRYLIWKQEHLHFIPQTTLICRRI